LVGARARAWGRRAVKPPLISHVFHAGIVFVYEISHIGNILIIFMTYRELDMAAKPAPAQTRSPHPEFNGEKPI